MNWAKLGIFSYNPPCKTIFKHKKIIKKLNNTEILSFILFIYFFGWEISLLPTFTHTHFKINVNI